MKKIAFIVSSIGDTDLALATTRFLEDQNLHEIFFIALTKTALDRVQQFESPLIKEKIAINEILHQETNSFPLSYSDEDIHRVKMFLYERSTTQIYIGVTSTINHRAPFQIAQQIDDIPVLMAYEFMFKPEQHALWDYLPLLNEKENIQWAVPLDSAREDFLRGHVIGHISIDHAFPPKQPSSKSAGEIREQLHVDSTQSLMFLSSTTQPVAVDVHFLEAILRELPNHPTVQIRLGLHPGIEDLDAYLSRILQVYEQYGDISHQFKIIHPDNLQIKIKRPEETIESPLYGHLFLRANVSGAEAGWAAERIGQAVPGALLNQAALEGKQAFFDRGESYLPPEYFSENIMTFFSGPRRAPHDKNELGLGDETAPTRCAALL